MVAVGQNYSVFISAVTREFGAARERVAAALRARNFEVRIQSSFGQAGGTTLAMLHDYIGGCDRVIAVIGAYSGMYPPDGAVTDEFRAMLPPGMARASMTQWEVIFAQAHQRDLYFFEANGFRPEGEPGKDNDSGAQAAWRDWLFDKGLGLHRRQFHSAEDLRAHVMELEWPNFVRPKPSNLPGSIGHLFKGRMDFLETLREGFRHNSATAITSKAVNGLGGIGKTRVAIEYGHAYASGYSATFFLIGKSEGDLSDSLAALADGKILDLPEKDLPDLDARVTAVIRWLLVNPNWFVIIDNVDDDAAVSAAYAFLNRVSRGEGHVLLTSRVSDWGGMVEPLELDLLSAEAAKELLRESTPHRTLCDDDDATLTRLAEEQLGCLSLALVQAAAYVEERRIGFAEYCELFDSEAAKLLAKLGKSAMRNLGYPLPVALTWQTTIAQLSDTGRFLLDMLSWLSIEPIPRSLFDVWPRPDTFDLKDGLVELTQYSLVHWEAENSAITLHRLVAQVTRDNLDADSRDRALAALVPWLNAVNPFINASDVRCWPSLLPLLPHVLLLHDRTREFEPFSEQTKLYNDYATLLEALARYAEAEPLFQSALAIAEALYGPEHLEVATPLNNLGGMLWTVGRLDEAETILRRSISIYESSATPGNPQLAPALVNFAVLLQSTGRFAEAEPFYERAIELLEASFGPDHPILAPSLNNLAELFRILDRPGEAEALYRRALAVEEAAYGPDHLNLTIRLNNLAIFLNDAGRWTEAEPLYRRAVLIVLRASKASGHWLPYATPAIRNYWAALMDTGLEANGIFSIIAGFTEEAGFDPAEILPRIRGGDPAPPTAP